MASLLQQLENNEAIVLMYLADELPSEDRVEVEQLLERDAGLRAELARVRDVQSALMAGIAELDKAEPLRVPEAVLARRASNLMRQWHVDRLVDAPITVDGPSRLRIAWWLYPAVSVAAIVLAAVAWWGIQPDEKPAVADRQSSGVDGERPWMSRMTPEQRQLVAQVAGSYNDSEDANGNLADAEQQAMALASHGIDSPIIAE